MSTGDGNTSAAQRPDATIGEAWRQYTQWAHTAGTGKRAQTRARTISLALAIAGAVLATVAGADYLPNASSALATVSAACIAVAAFVGRELLTPDRESKWALCRMLAESIQREAWLALMRVPPYDGPEAADALTAKIGALQAGAKLEQTASDPGSHAPPTVTGIDDYLDARVQDQIDWYERRARELAAELARWRVASFALGLIAVLLGLSVWADSGSITLWVPVVTTVSAMIVAHVQTGRFAGVVPLYQASARQLRLEAAKWRDGRVDSPVDVVRVCEEIMARENESWRTEWLSRETQERSASPESRPKEPAT